MDAVSIVAGLCVATFAVMCGYRGRGASHAISPKRDPILLSVLMLQGLLLALDVSDVLLIDGISISGEYLALTDTSALISAVMTGFDAGYVIGYLLCRPGDVLYLDLPDDTLTMADIVPMVHYRRDGELYIMPQTLKGIVLSFLGARHPADIPIYEIARTRMYTLSNGIRPSLTINAVPASLHETEEIEVGLIRIGRRKIRDENRNIVGETQRYLFHTTVTSHRVRFAQTVVDDHLSFWVKDDIYLTAIRDAVQAEEKAARMEIQMQTARFDAGAELVAGLVSLSTDSPDAVDDILSRIERERSRIRGDADDAGEDDP